MKGIHIVSKKTGYPEGWDRRRSSKRQKALSFTVPYRVCDAGNNLLPLADTHDN